IPPSKKVIEAIIAFLSNSHHLNWYPELSNRNLLRALSGYTGCPDENILVTSGSDEALAALCDTFLDEGDDVLVPFPTYTHFLIFAKSSGARVRLVEGRNPFIKFFDAVLDSIRIDTKLVYLVSPTNPTGIIYDERDIKTLCLRFPETLFIVDEAYAEFAGHSIIGLVGEFGNLAVTRTFSKSFGIAGLRIGYLAAQKTVLDSVKKIFNPKSVNSLAQIAALAALSDMEYHDRYVSEVCESKQILRRELSARGLDPVITPANFILFRVGNPAEFIGRCEEYSVFVRDRSHLKGLEGYVRMNAPTVEQTHEFLRRLDLILG
ncbi:MAG: histidinol-phosphate aminotransferase family protein, partial [Deltaproteobacteria bacterium]|nr:histidinol-phosphate aminotransferase family protein [Deltaproteobacteria bacterium]